MPIIEILGTPRSGKTGSIDKICSPGKFKCFRERFDLNPFPQSDLFNYNLWYAKFVIKGLEKARNSKHLYLFDRGIIDRLVFGKALFDYKVFTRRQYLEYSKLLRPYISSTDKGYIVILSPQQSLKQIKSKKDNITRDINFLRVLNKEYLWAGQEFRNFQIIRPKNKSHNLYDLLKSNLDIVLKQEG